jgi:hypothetical protein
MGELSVATVGVPAKWPEDTGPKQNPTACGDQLVSTSVMSKERKLKIPYSTGEASL